MLIWGCRFPGSCFSGCSLVTLIPQGLQEWGSLHCPLQTVLPASSIETPSFDCHVRLCHASPPYYSLPILHPHHYRISVLIPNVGATSVAQTVKNLPAVWETQETWARSLGQEDPLEKEVATHSSILAWRIPWTEEPGGLQSMESHRARHDWATHTHTHTLSLSLSLSLHLSPSPLPFYLPWSFLREACWASVPGVAESDMTDSHTPTPFLPPMIILELLLWWPLTPPQVRHLIGLWYGILTDPRIKN